MISGGGPIAFGELHDHTFDVFFYGLGFETRATKIVSSIGKIGKVYALKMPRTTVHSYERNMEFAKSRQHRIIEDFGKFARQELKLIFAKRQGPLRVGFDISSVNRLMLVGLLNEMSDLIEDTDEFSLFYCPASFVEPSWQFPQIEKLGPASELFSGFDSDPSKPLCLVLGLGFEAGVSMGIISQLEPSNSLCFWGKGVDVRFDQAVERANFDFNFPTFNTKVLSYNVDDPKGAFELLESVIYGLVRDYRVVIVPMGPKLFTAIVTLVGMSYFGELAIWRVQHSPIITLDSPPGDHCVIATIDTRLLADYASRAAAVFPA